MNREDPQNPTSHVTNGGNGQIEAGCGRDQRTGRFVKGCKPGPGNPNVRNLASTRARLILAVSDEDFDRIAKALIDAAERGEPWAVKELLDRLIGKPRSEPPN